MAQVLSQDEIDALLGGISNQQVATAETAAAKRPQGAENTAAVAVSGDLKLYDFTRSEISTRGRLPGLEVILNDFSRRLQSMFASQLGKSVDVSYDGMEVVAYSTLIQSLPLPASIHVVRLEPLRGMGILVVEARIAFAMVELFFGGTGSKVTKVEGRDFTPIETAFLGKFVARMLKGMEESWQSVIPLKGRYIRSELNPYLLNVAGSGDAIILATYSINMSPISGSILFSLPLSAIEELRDQLKTGVQMNDNPESLGLFKRARQPLMNIEVEVQAVVDVVNMSLGEIMGLRAGDILQLNVAGLEEMELWVEGKRKFIGKGAQRNGNKVFVASRPCA
ncbi:MAG TPA: flagellar motor switch protein FliM [Terriglobales bacterium]|jgi:flagellar motor switch protein FliM|nr:flagellar motor switch protein FliM [Terriglobales bacterium]